MYDNTKLRLLPSGNAWQIPYGCAKKQVTHLIPSHTSQIAKKKNWSLSTKGKIKKFFWRWQTHVSLKPLANLFLLDMGKIREDGSLPAYIFWLPAKTQRVLHLLEAIHWLFNQRFFKRLNKFLINERSFKSHQDQPWLFARQLQATRGRISTNLSLQKQQLLTGNSVVFPLHGAKNVSKREKYALISDNFPDFPHFHLFSGHRSRYNRRQSRIFVL